MQPSSAKTKDSDEADTAQAGRGLMAGLTDWFSGRPDTQAMPDEATLLERRRTGMGLAQGDGYEALALSGGGIRSATFSLGVLQAVAEAEREVPAAGAAPRAVDSFKASMLSRFDYLSTVSGGGFIGSFLVGLFVPKRLRDASNTAARAADDAQAVLGDGPPERIRTGVAETGAFRLKAPLAWLRENGRYLTPTGSGDLVYAAALGLRNWISLHVVIGLALLLALTLLAALRSWLLAQPWAGPLSTLEGHLLAGALGGAKADKSPALPIWWSSLFGLALVPLVLWVLPTGIAYWTTSRRDDGVSLPVNRSMLGMVLATLVFVALSAWGAGDSAVLPKVWLGLGLVTLFGVVIHVVLALAKPNATLQSVLLTRWLATGLLGIAVLALLGVIETLGNTLYLLTVGGSAWLPSLPAALSAVLAWLGKQIASAGKSEGLPGWLRKLPLTTLGGLGGLAILLLVATLWAWVVQVLAWGGDHPTVAAWASREHLLTLLVQAAAWLALAAGVGQFPGFINLSSLQGFYAARLTRTYLGASNGRRFDGHDPRALTAAEPLDGDNLPLDQFWSRAEGLKTWAPLHIVNVTVNKTIDPAEQLVQRDRKGQPMAVMPFGFRIDDCPGLFKMEPGQLHAPMHLGEWVGTSGAAFSTGIGRETTLGMSLLMGAANVRLGVWWASGLDNWTRPKGWRPLVWLGRGVGAVFRTQTYLTYEFSARFFGLRRKWQYLSDGGHFENTALYELLRPKRRVGFILASDNGADPNYQFDDLANLIRLARIDLHTDVRVVRDFNGYPELAKVFGTTAQFSAGSKANPAGLLLYAEALPDADIPRPMPCWIVLLKPGFQMDAPADVLQYAKTHPTFPQEPTSDQFFDEAQWESYRCLGRHIARRVLAPEVRAELRGFMAAGRPR